MVTEIELKAHVQNSEALKLLLQKNAIFLFFFEKNDNYWIQTTPYVTKNPPLAPFSSGLRIRRERRTLPDGTIESLSLATYKIKEVRDGVEINEEREFAVDPASGFEEFLIHMGFVSGISKQKRGCAFSREGISAELLEVKGLGWFLELEIIIEDIKAGNKREEAAAQAKKRLLAFLDSLGIEREAIESRFYSEMLGKS